MSLSILVWLAVGAYALHIIEEHVLDWFGWARKTMNLNMEWDTYVTVEATFLVLGVVAAMSASAMPMVGLAFIVLLVINVTVFHLLPMAMAGGRFSPGTISGVLLFYPIGWLALTSGSASAANLSWAVVIGAAVILWPMLLLQLKREAYFRGEAAVAKRPAKRRR
jgi:hypothetical protein